MLTECEKELANLQHRIAVLEHQISDNKNLEEKLHWLATFPEQNPNMVIETNMHGDVTYVNPEAKLRYPDLIQLSSNHPVLKGLKPIIASFAKSSQDYKEREIDMGVAVLEQKICYTQHGNTFRIRIYAHDITARKRAEEAIQKLAKQIVITQEEERQRISRELHDEAGQALTALKIGLELILDEVSPKAQKLRQNLDEAIALTDATRDRIRLLARDLRPPALDTVGLNLTLEDFCKNFARRTHLTITYEGVWLPKLADGKNICLYRFLQEALTNVAKHAKASQVKVILWCDKAAVHLSIQDNGIGFNKNIYMSGNQAAGLGLLGMQERVELQGGHLEIQSTIRQGTQVVAHLPLE